LLCSPFVYQMSIFWLVLRQLFLLSPFMRSDVAPSCHSLRTGFFLVLFPPFLVFFLKFEGPASVLASIGYRKIPPKSEFIGFPVRAFCR